MTAQAALQAFFASFGIDAYPETALADEKDIPLPYLTYQSISNGFGIETPIIVNLWYYTASEKEPNAKAREIRDRVNRGGAIINYDNGKIWIKMGSPFCQSLTDANDSTVKRRYINLSLEYLEE